MMKLFHDPVSTTSRPVLLFLAEHAIEVEKVAVSLHKGEHQSRDYAAINPNRAVPALVEDGRTVTECSAILKYLADLAQSPAYPLDLRMRARINAMMDWFNTGLSKDFLANYCYPQMFPHHRHDNPAVQASVLRRGLERSRTWLSVLEDHYLAQGGDWLFGDQLTIADYLGAVFLSVGDAVDFDFTPWPRTTEWMDRMRARPSWLEEFPAFYGLVAALRERRTRREMNPLGLAALAVARRSASQSRWNGHATASAPRIQPTLMRSAG